jgi:hypothetical protein
MIDIHKVLTQLPNENKLEIAITCSKYNISIQDFEKTLGKELNAGMKRIIANLKYLEYEPDDTAESN